MPDVLVAEISLDRPGVLASIRQRVAGGVAQHVCTHLEQPGLLAGPLDQPIEALPDRTVCRAR